MRHSRLVRRSTVSLVALVVIWLAAVACSAEPGVSPSSLDCASTPGASLAGIPTPSTCVDSGFRPASDGFAFANWAATTTGDAIGTDTLVALFGRANVCVDAAEPQCTPRPAAVQWAAQMNEILANGRCEGMSVAAERFFAGLSKVADVDATAGTAADLARDNPRLVKDIDYWWATQLMPEVAAAAQASRALPPSQIVTDVVEGLRGGSANTLGIYARPGAHSLTPFAVTYDEPWFSIWVYDSNHPGESGRVLVDAASEQWHYQSRVADDVMADDGWNGTGPGGLEYTPMSVRMKDFTTPFSDDTAENRFALTVVATSADSSTEVDLQITGSGVELDTADQRPAPDGFIVQRIDDDGIGHGTIVYVRPTDALTITASVSEDGVPIQISIDGPDLPWQEITTTSIGSGHLPLQIEVAPTTGTRVDVTGALTVTVSYDTGVTKVDVATITGPGVLLVPPR